MEPNVTSIEVMRSEQIFRPIFGCVIMSICSLLSLIANILLLWTIARQKFLYNFHFISIANIALCDLVLTLLTPITLWKLLIYDIFIEKFLCGVYSAVPTIHVLSITITVLLLAVVRLKYDTSFQFGVKKDHNIAIFVMIAVWIISLLVALVLVLFADDSTSHFCVVRWPINTFIFYIITSFVPLFIATIPVVWMIAKVRNQMPSIENLSTMQLDPRFDIMVVLYWTLFFTVNVTCQSTLIIVQYKMSDSALVVVTVVFMLLSFFKVIIFFSMDRYLQKAFTLTFRKH